MTTALQTMRLPVLANSLEGYLRSISQIPMLTQAQEQSLAQQFYEEQNVDAARQLVLAHLRFVARIAKSYQGYGLPLADLIQEGNIGLMKAVQRFNPFIGVRLVTFAVHWIKAEIHEFIIRNWRMVKIATTKAQRKLFFNLRQLKNAKNCLTWFTPDEIQDVAATLKVSPEEVVRMEARLSASDVAFDLPSEMHDDEHIYAPAQYLEDPQANPEHALVALNSDDHAKAHLSQAFESLDERTRDILTKRWLAEPKATLQELAAQYQVSAERIRQLEKNAFAKLKIALDVAEVTA
jgi:RNA polymerase sigma-32 factor